ncbi:hypothetical protein KPL71_022280 [Citrus sinensis]|uniref:Uncharacterized protein n=1 Tax=Citrus sinensis TaxID=2711 RepID=A0ACB8JNY1_CITSI|nr:hypothetical protein KPL71_022280 [Citrus sinensis]
MVDAVINVVLDQLISISLQEAREELRLVVGVDQEVERLKRNFRAIQAVLVDAEQRQVKEEAVRLWLDKLKHASYDMEDVLDEWITARLKLQILQSVDGNALVPQRKVRFFSPAASCFGFKQIFLRRDIAVKIKEINQNLDDIAKLKDFFSFNVITSTGKSDRIQSTALINVSEVRGRDEEKNSLKSKLLCESSQQPNAIHVISLVGMGGIGKTTLAQFAYNDNDVMNSFEIRMWVCVSDPFDEFRVARAIIEALEGSASNLGELQSLLQRIQTSIAGKKFLLVLDDMWTDDYREWEPFNNCLMNGLRGSKILVTTRKKTVAQMMESTDVFSIKELSKQECWSLFKRFAFFGRHPSECEQLEEIGRKIVSRCKGLPLAAKTIGSLLRFKKTREEWQRILDSEMWKLKEFEKGLLAPLLLSYNDLPTMVKRCFSYCAVFPKDYNIEKDELIKVWMAQGYIGPKENEEMEIIGQEYFDYLATRSFFQEFEKDEEGFVIRCKMHDIVYDFAQFLTKNECLAVEVDGDEEPLMLRRTSKEKLYHLMLMINFYSTFPVSIRYAKKLRSLFLVADGSFKALSPVLPGLFDQLTCLRTLKITGESAGVEKSIREIPKEIEKLKHLRFLKLSQVDLEELPETCCELVNLQTLDIEACGSLKRLPQGIGKLVNLRHLMISHNVYLDYMPKGIERLTCLRTLRELVVSRKGCNLGGLRHLNHLRGSFRIRGLGNVTHVDEAKNSELDKKKNLVCLELWFDREEEEATDENEAAKHEATSEALRPNPNIEVLKIFQYKGKTVFPSWIMSLCKLKVLLLSFCIKCEIMPPLGKLPSLEVLSIWNMNSVKTVGDEFLGIGGDNGTSATSSVNVAFRKLKELAFWGLYEWEEWHFGEEDNITVMPQLNSLKIENCSKLKSLPDQLLRRTTLENLEIKKCPIVKERFRRYTRDDWSKINHIPNILIDDRYARRPLNSKTAAITSDTEVSSSLIELHMLLFHHFILLVSL